MDNPLAIDVCMIVWNECTIFRDVSNVCVVIWTICVCYVYYMGDTTSNYHSYASSPFTGWSKENVPTKTLWTRYAWSIPNISLSANCCKSDRDEATFIHRSIRINHYMTINNVTAFHKVHVNYLPTSDVWCNGHIVWPPCTINLWCHSTMCNQISPRQTNIMNATSNDLGEIWLDSVTE
jgi:hypothetical protein